MPADLSHDKPTASLNVRGVGAMNKKKRAKVASWLRRQAKLIENNGDETGKITTGMYRAGIRLASIMVLCLLVSGCVTKYDDIVSDFHTIQNSNQCTTVAFDQRKFNAETVEPPAISCPCDELKPVKRLVVKAGQSPEVMACLAPVPQVDSMVSHYESVGDGYTIRLVDTKKNHSHFIPSGHLHHQASLASTYVPAIGSAAAGGAIGGGIAAAQAARMTQSVTGSSVRTSTLVLDGPVPPGVAR